MSESTSPPVLLGPRVPRAPHVSDQARPGLVIRATSVQFAPPTGTPSSTAKRRTGDRLARQKLFRIRSVTLLLLRSNGHPEHRQGGSAPA